MDIGIGGVVYFSLIGIFFLYLVYLRVKDYMKNRKSGGRRDDK